MLQRRWREARAGHGGLVLISGEAGVGKTRLVREVADRLRWQGVLVLWGRCYEFERILPYQPLVEAIRTALPALTSDSLAGVPAWAIAEVGHLVPEVLEQHGPSAAPAEGDRESEARRYPGAADSGGLGQDQARLFEGVTELLADLSAQRPVLLVLEDLHWASHSTLGLLHYVARHLVDKLVMIVGTFRPEAVGPHHRLLALRRRLVREGLAHPLRLSRLSREAVETIVVEMSGAGERVVPLAARLYQETEGNPFFLMETVKALFETGTIRLEGRAWQGDFARISEGELPLPASVSDTILARVERLDESAQEAVRLATVLGREFDFELLSAVWRKDEEVTLEALDDLLRQRLISEGADEADADYVFTHHKIQEVVYEYLPRQQRQYLHGQVGVAMERLFEREIGTKIGELAFHFEQACRIDKGLTERAVGYLEQAGDVASRAYAHQEAIGFYERTLGLLVDGCEGWLSKEAAARVYEKLGDAHKTVGDRAEAESAYHLALDSTPKGNPIGCAHLHHKLALLIDWTEMDRARRSLEVAEATLGSEPLEPADAWWETWLDVQMRRAMLHYWGREPREMDALVKRIKPHVEEHGTSAQRVWLFGLLGNTGFALDRFVPTPQTLRYCEACLSAAQDLGDPRAVADSQFRMGFALLWLGRLGEAEEYLLQSQTYAIRAGILYDQLLCLTYLTILHRKRQQVEETETLAVRSLEMAQRTEIPHYVLTAKGSLAWVAWRKGDLKATENHGQLALDVWQSPDVSKSPFLWTAIWPLVAVALARGELRRATEYAAILLDPQQQRLPEAMTTALERAIDAWDKDQENAARRHLERAADIAANLGYV
jgi:tetratricopeptide (TPR) repeat protein